MAAPFKVIEPAGILDSNQAEPFRQAVEEALTGGVEVILVDLKDTTFIDSSGLGSLVMVLKKVRAQNRRMYFCSINDQVRMLFDLTGMDRVFDVLKDRHDFEVTVLGESSAER
ncbi:MAG TPA: STAS domain-containing protein [Leptolyngbyaceae cyanobacterium]